MESALQNEAMVAALRALMVQMDEGVDEWTLDRPQSRFYEAAQEKAGAAQPQAQGHAPPSAPQQAPEAAPIAFENLQSEDEILQALRESLPVGLSALLHDPVPDLGSENAEIAVIIDPPFREAAQARALDQDASTHLLLASLRAIRLDLDSRAGQEPRAQIRILPISPWRIPQDRKLLESEAQIFLRALRARLDLFDFRAILFAGSNLGGLSNLVQAGQWHGLPAVELVAPRMMLKEPMLKRLHWQKLLDFNDQLETILTL